MFPEKWKLLYAKMETRVLHDQHAPDSLQPVLWVARLDREKRPALLVNIARALLARASGLQIDVFGCPTLDEFDIGRLTALANVRYNRLLPGFESLPPKRYLRLAYT